MSEEIKVLERAEALLRQATFPNVSVEGSRQIATIHAELRNLLDHKKSQEAITYANEDTPSEENNNNE